jgi:hypothetical protein
MGDRALKVILVPVGVLRTQLQVQQDSLLVGGERLVRTLQLGEPNSQHRQRHRQVGAEGPRAGRRQLPVDRLDDRGQRLLQPAELGQPERQVVQRAGQVRAEGVRRAAASSR